MDALLKLAAEAGLHVSAAEEALGEGGHTTAREEVDRADDALADLRAAWPTMSAAERTLVGKAAAPLRERLDRVRRALPKVAAVSEAAPVEDPEQDEAPDEPGAVA